MGLFEGAESDAERERGDDPFAENHGLGKWYAGRCSSSSKGVCHGQYITLHHIVLISSLQFLPLGDLDAPASICWRARWELLGGFCYH